METVWDGEKAQVHCYMFMMEVERCKLIKQFKGEVREHMINFDYDFWDWILIELKRYCDIIRGEIYES